MSDIVRFRGDTKSLYVTVTDKNDNPVPTTSTTLVLTISSEENPVNTDSEILSKPAIIADVSLAKYEFVFDEADVDFIGDHYFDLEFTDADGKKSTIDKGTWTMNQDITK